MTQPTARLSLTANDCRLLQEAIDMLLTDYQESETGHKETKALDKLDRRLSQALARLAPHPEP